MNETRVVVTCAERQVYWVLGAEPATCTDARHVHHEHVVHRHRDVVVLPDGTQVRALSFDPSMCRPIRRMPSLR